MIYKQWLLSKTGQFLKEKRNLTEKELKEEFERVKSFWNNNSVVGF